MSIMVKNTAHVLLLGVIWITGCSIASAAEFSEIDRNKDNRLQAEEMFATFGVQSQSFIERWDADRDGVLTRREIRTSNKQGDFNPRRPRSEQDDRSRSFTPARVVKSAAVLSSQGAFTETPATGSDKTAAQEADKAGKTAEREARKNAKAERQAEREAKKATRTKRQEEREAKKAARAQRQAEREAKKAAKAQRHAEREAKKAEKQAKREAKKAAKAQRQAEREAKKAAKAQRQAEREAKKASKAERQEEKGNKETDNTSDNGTESEDAGQEPAS